jgi:hypothetical protein
MTNCCGHFMGLRVCAGLVLALIANQALAGPPYVSDDPEPTDYKHFEIYTFTNGTTTRDRTAGASGIDFNYGAAPDLQLTATVPAGFDRPVGGGTNVGLSNIELASKYRFLHQDGSDWTSASSRGFSFRAARTMSATVLHRCCCRCGSKKTGTVDGRRSAEEDAPSPSAGPWTSARPVPS